MRPITTTPTPMNRAVMVAARPSSAGHFRHLSELRYHCTPATLLQLAQKRPSWPSAHEASPWSLPPLQEALPHGHGTAITGFWSKSMYVSLVGHVRVRLSLWHGTSA